MEDNEIMPKIELMQGDCLEKMKYIPDKTVDLVLCDLPYGTTQCKWDSVIDLSVLWAQYKRIAKQSAAFVLFSAQPFTTILISSAIDIFKYDWCWQKPKGTGHLNAKKQPMRDKEDICVFYREQCTYNPQITKGTPYKDKAGKDHNKATSMSDCYGAFTNYREVNTGFRYPKQVIQFGVVERGTLHPTQKPIPLLEYLIKTYTNDNEVVLDNCMGSGSTGVACKNLNRNFIGIELDQEYFKIAEKLINEKL
jgi:DNA modification methylase